MTLTDTAIKNRRNGTEMRSSDNWHTGRGTRWRVWRQVLAEQRLTARGDSQSIWQKRVCAIYDLGGGCTHRAMPRELNNRLEKSSPATYA